MILLEERENVRGNKKTERFGIEATHVNKRHKSGSVARCMRDRELLHGVEFQLDIA